MDNKEQAELLGLKFYQGKVRDTFAKDGYICLVATDRISAFDHILPKDVPGKGIVLNEMTKYALGKIGTTVPHWLIESPHPNILFGHACKPFKIEVVMRAYIVGSLWRKYSKDRVRECWGYRLPEGMQENQKLDEIMLTPTTKAEEGHDLDITEAEILEQGLATEEQWNTIKKYSEELFNIGTRAAKERGLILVDTKYEFGTDPRGTIRLIDEVHTPDSSRYFYADEYEERFTMKEKQKQLSKEFVREWLMAHGFEGKEGQFMPDITDEVVDLWQTRYFELLQVMTGETMHHAPPSINMDNVMEVMKNTFKKHITPA
ncbi:MAG: phosphoribosylaminoimidazolesuccinocarboxamide synthase [bacterium]